MAIDPAQVADAMASALAMVSRGNAVAPVRAHIDLGDGAGTFLISGVLTEFDLLSVKVINVRPQNPLRGLERLQGSLTAFESSTGRPLATLDARAATEVRTAACSAVSLRLLARADATVLTVFGTGPQAAAHLRAMTRETEFAEIRIVGRNQDAARNLADSYPGAKVKTPAEHTPRHGRERQCGGLRGRAAAAGSSGSDPSRPPAHLSFGVRRDRRRPACGADR
jgi:ornithine cyclodeaminase